MGRKRSPNFTLTIVFFAFVIVMLSGIALAAWGLTTPSDVAIDMGAFKLTTTSVGLAMTALGAFGLLILCPQFLKGARPFGERKQTMPELVALKGVIPLLIIGLLALVLLIVSVLTA